MEGVEIWKHAGQVCLNVRADAVVSYGTKQKHVEEHVPGIKPKVFTQDCLPLAPWHDELQHPHCNRKRQKKPEEVRPTWRCDHRPQISELILVKGYDAVHAAYLVVVGKSAPVHAS